MEQATASVPQELLDVFTDNGLALPPLPHAVVPLLQPVSEYAFSTDPDWMPVVGGRVVFASLPTEAITDTAFNTASDEARFYCGIDGYGVQNWSFRYVLESTALNIGLVLPYGSVFGNAQAELQRIEDAYDVIQSCFAATRGGQSFGSSKEARLYMTLDRRGLHFAVSDHQGALIQEGATLSAFVDLLTVWGAEANGNGPQDWMRV